ncbi:MAG: DUF1186 domain-containing protein [Caldilineaceae bacterium]|nr:DUF1186 domain-containing protein [Caldilineaceae bacterium]
MNPSEIIAELSGAEGFFPREAMEAAIAQREEITPHLLDYLREVIDDSDSEYVEAIGPVMAIYLLAQFRETRAYPLLVEMASLPPDRVDVLFGEFITEGLGRALASVSGGEIAGIQQLIENEVAHEWVRVAGIEALETLLGQGFLSPEALHDYYQKLYTSLERVESVLWSELVHSTAVLHFADLRPEVDRLFADGLIDLMIDDANFVTSLFETDAEATFYEEIVDSPYRQLIDDAIGELEEWAAFDEEEDDEEEYDEGFEDFLNELTARPLPPIDEPDDEPVETFVRMGEKIGRNDPCPCGSGKKYKQCHGKPGGK